MSALFWQQHFGSSVYAVHFLSVACKFSICSLIDWMIMCFLKTDLSRLRSQCLLFVNSAHVFLLLSLRVAGQGNVLCQGCPHRRRHRWTIKHQIIKSTRVGNTNLSAGLVLCLLMLASSFQNAKTLCTLVACGSKRRCSLMRLFYSPAWPGHKTSCHAKVMPRNKGNLCLQTSLITQANKSLCY